MQNDYRHFCCGFGDQAFEIGCNNAAAYILAEFLFADFPKVTTKRQPVSYDIVMAGAKPHLSLWTGERKLYFGTSYYKLAYILMNEVIFHCINTNASHHALHAGAVNRGESCILLPGNSGSGKSTLTAWLVSRGCNYLTDELVLLANDGRVSPLTRPISLKVNSEHISWPISEHCGDQIISCDEGSMIPHRLLNPQFKPLKPRVSHIVFPKFSKGAAPDLEEISPAKSSFYLMQSHVNARNLHGHGVTALSTIVRQCRSYTLTYGSFRDLEAFFRAPSGPFS